MTTQFDTIIIGGGPAGLAAAYGLKAAGQSVAVIEKDRFGGTCPNRGCDPKKILLAAVEARDHQQQMAGQGIDGHLTINWPDLMRNKRAYTDQIPTGTVAGLARAGVTAISGTAHFKDRTTLLVDDQAYTASQFVITAGQQPVIPDIPGQEWLQTSTDFLDMDTVPADLTVLGGGYVGVELASIATAAGSHVRLIHHNDRPLKAFDADLVTDYVAQLQQKGVTVQLDRRVTQVSQQGQRLQVTTDDGAFTTDMVLAATGRRPDTDELGLAAAGVQTTKRGIVVDDYLQTTNPHIWAAGDVVDRPEPKLTPVASFEGRYVAEQVTQATTAAIAYPAIPTVVFGSPRLAKVGLDPHMVAQDDRYRVKTLAVTDWYTYRRIHDPFAKVMVVIDRTTGQLVGAQVLSTEADELINYLTVVIDQHLDHTAILRTIFAYPTPASDLPYLG